MGRKRIRTKGRAWAAFQDVFGQREGVSIDRLWVTGDGTSRRGVGAYVEFDPDPEGESARYVALVPNWDADADFPSRAKREAALLERLAEADLDLRVPRLVGMTDVDTGPVLVESLVHGLPVEFRTRRRGGEPWRFVALVGAALHRLDPDGRLLEGYATRRAHGEACLAESEGLETEDATGVVVEARAWMAEHLPPDEPAALLHGDLLGQNILVPMDASHGLGLIDWEFAMRGDPAYDLAVVTGGARRPFQQGRGLERLLDSYATAGGAGVSLADVGFYELYLRLRSYAASLGRTGYGESPEQLLQQLRGTLDRVMQREG